MPKARVVTGFIPLKDHPRPVEEYEKLGRRLSELGNKMEQKIFMWQDSVTDTWLANYLVDSKVKATHAVADNLKKNTIAYHCVQHQKTEWLYESGRMDDSDVMIWIDFGIFSVPGVTEEAILAAVDRAKYARTIMIPGCWDTPGDRGDDNPNWRFCGGFLVVPTQYTFALDVAMKAEAIHHLSTAKKLTWEVNTLARVEKKGILPIEWYKADHNASMFENLPTIPQGLN